MTVISQPDKYYEHNCHLILPTAENYPQGTVVMCDTCGRTWIAVDRYSGFGSNNVWVKNRWFHFRLRRHG